MKVARLRVRPQVKMLLRSTLMLSIATAPCLPAHAANSSKSGVSQQMVTQSRRHFRTLSSETYFDKVQGGWMGKMIGVTFGQPWEFEYQNAPIGFDITDWTLSADRMKVLRGKAENQPGDTTPITDPRNSDHVRLDHLFIEQSERDHPSYGAPDNDDIYVNLLFLYCLERYGIEVDPVTVAREWDAHIKAAWHANKQGLENIRRGIMPPDSGNPRNNPHADDIDFQIESDIFGMISPGMPRVSNLYGQRMGHIMNYGDGVYGGMFISAMYTEAFFTRDIRKVVHVGLRSIPKRSVYAQLIRDVIRWHEQYPHDWLKTWQLVQQKWGNVDHCPDGYMKPYNIDAKLNGGYVVMGLLYGEGDFYRTMNYATRAGQDADCNPANAAGILGVMLGARGIPTAYSGPLHNTYWNTSLANFPERYEVDRIAEETGQVGIKVLLANGGFVDSVKHSLILHIPSRLPQPPRDLEQVRWEGIVGYGSIIKHGGMIGPDKR